MCDGCCSDVAAVNMPSQPFVCQSMLKSTTSFRPDPPALSSNPLHSSSRSSLLSPPRRERTFTEASPSRQTPPSDPSKSVTRRAPFCPPFNPLCSLSYRPPLPHPSSSPTMTGPVRTRGQERRRRSPLTSLLAGVIQLALATTSVHAAQPTYPGDPMNFKLVGDAGVSAQQIFLGTPDRVSQPSQLFRSRPSVRLDFCRRL